MNGPVTNFQPGPSVGAAASAITLLAQSHPAPRTPLPALLGRCGALELRLATTARDIRKAQELRHRVFFEDRQARPFAKQRIDRDAFDAICDHLLVIDTASPGRDVVGTYRLLRQDIADATHGFYSAAEFDVQPLLARHAHLNFLELGRSCVLPAYRDKRTIALLWQGLWAYVQHYRIGAMIGCASFEGTDAGQHALALSYLHHNARAAWSWYATAHSDRRARFALINTDAIDARAALRAMPPLIKGYLRAGARFTTEPVIDHAFGTVDVFVVMPTAEINPRYVDYFSTGGTRCAA
ncbi:MAG: GNAT family N-acetyltransferase [Beijerinckiaceae bacterium]